MEVSFCHAWELLHSASAFRRVAEGTNCETSTPLSIIKHLNPRTPASTRGTRWFFRSLSDFQANFYALEYRVYLVTGDDPTPEADVRPTLALCGIAFDHEVLHGSRWRDRIERHIHNGGHTPRKSSSGTCPETFPICSTWLVQVYVCAWEEKVVSLDGREISKSYSTSPGRMMLSPASMTSTVSSIPLKGPSITERIIPLSASTTMEASMGSSWSGRRTLEPWKISWFGEDICRG